MQKEKGISTLIGIIIIVAVAVILFGGVFSYQYYIGKSEARNSKFETNSNIQDSNIETAGWETYTNAKYGFELKYPVNYYIDASYNPFPGLFSDFDIYFKNQEGSVDFSLEVLGGDFGHEYSECATPLVYTSSGDVCEELEFNGIKAAYANSVVDAQGTIPVGLHSSISFTNTNGDELFTFNMRGIDDGTEFVENIPHCTDNQIQAGDINNCNSTETILGLGECKFPLLSANGRACSQFLELSKDIMEQRKRRIDQRQINIIKNALGIVSTFKFTK